jgi:hypothetical protein
MLKFWVYSANSKSYSRSKRKIIKVIYLMILTSYFCLDSTQQSAMANLFPAEIVNQNIDRAIGSKNTLTQSVNINGSALRSTDEQQCLLDLKTKLNNRSLPPRRFARSTSPNGNSCELASQQRGNQIFGSNLQAVIDPLLLLPISTPLSTLASSLSIVPIAPSDRTIIALPNSKPIPNLVKDPRYQID